MQLEKLRKLWISEATSISEPATDVDLSLFNQKNNLVIPKDLSNYFKLLNGTNEEYDNRLFQFYSLKQFKSIDEELKSWNGLPDYSKIVDSLRNYRQFYIFADFSFHMFSYGICLYENERSENEILVISGAEYKQIASSFSEFIELYLDDSIELLLNRDNRSQLG